MHDAWLIAKREYLERVRSKTFRISTVLIPVVFALIFGLGAISGKVSGRPRTIVVASNDPALAQSVRTELTHQHSTRASNSQPIEPMQVGVVAPASAADLASLNRDVQRKTIDGYLWLDVGSGQVRPQATYVSRGSADMFGEERMRNAIVHAVTREELMKRGVSSAEVHDMLQSVDLKTMAVKDGRTRTSDAHKGFWSAYVMAFVLYFAIVFYGMNVAQSVVAEKTSRVFEVLLASTRPESLMAGKLLGVGAAGLTQMAIWIVAVFLLSAPALGAQLGHGGIASYGVTPLRLAFFVIYFLLGFFFYSALSAAFGATVSQPSEVQQFAMVLVLPLLVGIILIVYILGNPAALPVVLLSLFPPCMPVVMCLRMSAMAVPWWQLGLSLALMLASTYAVLWFASRIYRVGILMYGKRATLPEIVRWLRYS